MIKRKKKLVGFIVDDRRYYDIMRRLINRSTEMNN